MDLFVTILLVLGLSISKISKERNCIDSSPSIEVVQQLEVCTNILMEREVEPFERIVKELGLKC